MTTTYAARILEQGKKLAKHSGIGRGQKAKALNKEQDDEQVPRQISSNEGVFSVSILSSKRTSKDTTTTSTSSKGKEPVQETPADEPAEKSSTKTDEAAAEPENTTTNPTHQDNRYKGNPTGVGCHRWFSEGSWCPTSGDFCSREKPLPRTRKAGKFGRYFPLEDLPHCGL